MHPQEGRFSPAVWELQDHRQPSIASEPASNSKTEELFAAVSGGQKFSRLDQAHAYQQMALDDTSSELVTLHTHRGLYRSILETTLWNRLGAIFQNEMERILAGLEHVVV